MILKILMNSKKIIKFISELYKLIIFFCFKNKKISCFFLENNFSHEYLEYYIKKKANRDEIIILKNDKIDISNYLTNYELSINFNFLTQLFFLFFKGKVIYSTTPDLNKTYFVKSIFSKVKYVYFQHSLISLSRGYLEKSLYILMQ